MLPVCLILAVCVFCWAGQENLTTRVRLFDVRGDQHGAGEKDRRILQTAVSGRVHSVQRAVLAVLFAKLKKKHTHRLRRRHYSNA